MDCDIINVFNFGRNIKQVENININDDSLDLKFPKRTIVDISTDTFIKIIFQDNNNYYLFLNYVNALDFYLNYYVNINLACSNSLPLNGDEHIDVYFKGGNVMNYHFTTMIEDSRLKELFGMYFKKSDFDFSVDIHTTTDNRFNDLKKHAYPWIIDFLCETTRLFNEYLESIAKGKIKILHMDPKFLSTFKNDTDTFKFMEIRDTVKDIISHPRFKLLKEIIDGYIKINGVKHIPFISNIDVIGKYIRVNFNSDIIQFIPKSEGLYKLNYTPYILNDINKFIMNYNEYIIQDLIQTYYELHKTSKYYACLLYPYYKHVIGPILEHEIEYPNLINKVITYNFSLIQQSNFYTDEKLKTMTKLIKESISMLPDTYYEKNTENPPNENEETNPKAFIKYKITSNNNSQISLDPTNNFIVYNNFENHNPLSTLNFGKDLHSINDKSIKNNIHYVSGNLLIKNTLGNRQVVDFDLFRIKFNLVALDFVSENDYLVDKFKIPSEFIDVSVTTIDSNVYNEDHEIFIMPIDLENIKLPNIPVKSHSYTYFIGDLIRILFTDSNFFPWLKGKYEKRIKRLLLLLNLYDGLHHTNNLDIIYNLASDIKYNMTNTDNEHDITKYSASKVHLDSYKEYTNIFDLVYINDNYKLVKQPIKMLLIVSEIFKRNDALEIINHFRKYLKLTPIKNLGNLKQDFIKFLDEIINTYHDIKPINNSISNKNNITKKRNFSKLKK
ncbi:hypothetical protein QLL95_gp0808 [Cotonvirus japonicus]|uniref:Uncharacterized protein n=1 Tax=Cotonvirus japonicus TaxID=2811091 RepID=A0ABM7NT21_9VIRU|nr:hypothetical protein QLL95_gp0808 [Cotonvirus japonicus]BCS83315.1 hypothetical protein [Cotonvirus japonicus]